MDIIEKIGDTITEKGKRTGGYCKSEEPDFYLRRSDEEKLSGDRQDLF